VKPTTSRPGSSDVGEDSILRRLTREDRAKLSMDAWEPSLLRHLMKAQDKLRTEEKLAREAVDAEKKGERG
jgi:hypothetical protein